MATLRAIYQDHKKPEHKVGFSLLWQEGRKRGAGRAKRKSEKDWGMKRGSFKEGEGSNAEGHQIHLKSQQIPGMASSGKNHLR